MRELAATLGQQGGVLFRQNWHLDRTFEPKLALDAKKDQRTMTNVTEVSERTVITLSGLGAAVAPATPTTEQMHILCSLATSGIQLEATSAETAQVS